MVKKKRRTITEYARRVQSKTKTTEANVVLLEICPTCETITRKVETVGGGADIEIKAKCCETCDKTTVGSRRPHWLTVPQDAKILRIVYFK